MSRFTKVDLDNWSDGEILKYLNLFAEENEQLKTELMIKEDLIQQLRNTLYTDDRKKYLEYRGKFIRVCEELAEMNMDYKKLSDENEQLKSENQELKQYLSWQDMELEEMEDLND